MVELNQGFDVLVIGGGNAGLCAAMTAKRGAASVLLLESSPEVFRGGNSRHTRDIRYMHERLLREGIGNVRTILSWPEDPLLPTGSINAFLLLKTYHEVAQPIRLLKHVRVAMRPGGRLGIIDRNGQGDDHGINADVVIKEAERAGFTLANQFDFVKADNVDYFLVFSAISRP